MPTNDKLNLIPLFDAYIAHADSRANPLPLSFFQSWASAYDALAPRGFGSVTGDSLPKVFGRFVPTIKLKNSENHETFETPKYARISNLAVYYNLQFTPHSEENDFFYDLPADLHPESFQFKHFYLKTPHAEWRAIANSSLIRQYRANDIVSVMRTIAREVGLPQMGSLGYTVSKDELEFLFRVIDRIIEDIFIISQKSKTNNSVTPAKYLYLTEAVFPNLTKTRAILTAITDKLLAGEELQNALPKEDKDQLHFASTTINDALYQLPLNSDLLDILFPYISSLVKGSHILPVCPQSVASEDVRKFRKGLPSYAQEP